MFNLFFDSKAEDFWDDEYNYNTAPTKRNIYLLDTSSSMSRNIEKAKEILTERIERGAGLIVFGEKVYFIPAGKIDGVIAYGNTAMLPAIKCAFERHKAESITIITDGDPNVGGVSSEILQYVANLVGVTINAIGLGIGIDKEFLKTLTEMTGGKYNHIGAIHELDSSLLLLEAPQKAINL